MRGARRIARLGGRVLLGLVALGTAARAHGLDPLRAMSQYTRDRWSSDRGFQGGAVRSIAQTADGHLWIGSERGLVRFDGLEFVLVQGSRGKPPVQVVSLAPAPGGGLWVRLPGPNLLLYRNGEFQSVGSRFEPPEDAFTSMSPSGVGRILLAGLVSGISRSNGFGFEKLSSSVTPRSPVIAMAEASDGTVWLGTRDAGLFYLQDGRVTPVVRGLPDRKVNCLLAVEGREVWVGTDKGVVRWDGASLVTAGVPPPLRRIQALAMLKDRRSNLWIGTDAGLWRVNALGATRLEPRPGPSPAAVSALFQDREGNLWTGSEHGIERLRDSRFTTYATAEGLPSERIGPVYADPEGRTWFAPNQGGLFWLRGGAVERVVTAGLDSDVVYSIAGGREGVWVGRRRGGVSHLRVREGRLESRSLTLANGLAHESVYAVHEARDGSLWAGSLSGGVSRIRDGHLTTYTSHNTTGGLASDTVAAIADDGETTWFATPAGLSALSNEGWRTYTARDGLPSDEVSCLLVGSSGALWIGTGDGLALRAEGRIRAARVASLSPSEQVFGMAEDAGGWLWLATSRRVLRVKEAQLRQGAADGADVTEFGLADGLRGVEGVKRHRSMVTDREGRIWLSTDAGLSVIDPSRLRGHDPVAARVVAVAADGRALRLQGPVRVPAARQRVAIRFDGVSLSVPERLRFRYRLDGFDHDWSEPTSSREADYTNLAPGSYAFRVRAFGLGEGWMGPESSLSLEVEPAFWQRTWVRLAAVLAVALALLALYRFRVRRVIRQLNLRFEERLAERNRIARELHDTLLQGCVSASMQLHVALEQLPDGSPARTLLGRVQQLIRQVIEEGRNTVGGLRSSAPDSGDLAQAFAHIREELAGDGSAELRVIVDGTARALHPSVRDELYRIGREALVNAFRHARASLVELDLEYGKRAVRLLVRDDGVGIAPQVLEGGRDGHYGLSGMRERAERIGARLRLWSAAGAGTEVELVVRSSLAYASPARGGLRGWLRRLRRASPRNAEVQRAARGPQDAGR